MHRVIILNDTTFTKVQQIANAIAADIDRNVLSKGTQLPSINEFSRDYKVARDTVDRAYKLLKRDGYITSISTKGYFVKGPVDKCLKILLIFNKLSSYKKIVYDAIIETPSLYKFNKRNYIKALKQGIALAF